jgi:acyl transferase domain-containing protein/phosphopantetheinyl transferase
MNTLQRPEAEAEDIAIVGMACVFPGADTPARFWQNILDRVNQVGDPPAEWQADRYLAREGFPEGLPTCKGGWLGDLCRFDPRKYGIMPAGVDGGEPDQFLAFRCAVEALTDAGFPELPLNRATTAVIVGRGTFFNRGETGERMHTYLVEQVVDLLRRLEPHRSERELALIRADLKGNLPPFTPEAIPGLAHCVLTGRIANRLDFGGPAYTLDAACASVLIAAEHAIRELRSGRCDGAVVGGVQVSTPVPLYQLFARLEALSRSGTIAPFSAGADGTLLAEGCGMLVLKRRSDAERDGNRIYAVLKAIGVSSDGRGSGLLAPRTEGQQLAIRRAYQESGVSPATIALVEAHGTGMPLGDRTEIESLRACFGSPEGDVPTVALGSIKSMIGHLLPAAGAASLIKTALALYHRVVPPTLHTDKPNPNLHLESSRFYLVPEPRPWIHGSTSAPRRAGVNSFGFGGINAHAVLEEYPTAEANLPRLDTRWPAELVVVSAANRVALREKVSALAGWIGRARDVRLLDVAASCAAEPGDCRVCLVSPDLETLGRKLAHVAKLLGEEQRDRIQDRSGIFWYRQPLARSGRLAFVFPGEGPQYPNMLADLCRHFPEVRRAFDLTESAIEGVRPGRRLSQLLFPTPAELEKAKDGLFQFAAGVQSVTAAQRALLDLVAVLGIRPDALVGHSSGEFGSLQAAGAIVADEQAYVQTVALGAENLAQLEQPGLVPEAVLTAVGAVDRARIDEVLAASQGRLQLAMDNCPNQFILVGDEEATTTALTVLAGRGALCQRLAWNRAIHTEAFAPACRLIEDYYRQLAFVSPRIELWSCATASRFPSEPEAVRELAVRQWRCPVRFRETIEAMYESGVRLFLEVGPGGSLSSFITSTLGKAPHLAVPLDLSRRHGLEQLCWAVGMLVAQGVSVNLSALYQRRRPRILDFTVEPPAPQPAEPKLDQGLPRLLLSESALASLRPSLPPRSHSQEVGVKSQESGVRSQESGVRSQESGVRSQESEPNAEPPTPARHATASSSSANMLVQFQQTMRLFLQTQENVTRAHFGRREAPAAGVEASPAAPTPAGSVNTTPFSPCSTPSASASVDLVSPSLALRANEEPLLALRAGAPVESVPPTPDQRSDPRHREPSRRDAPAAVETAGLLHDRLLGIVAERTGYPVEMIGLDADLEADLGIDSIKRVEILGAFRREAFPGLQEPPTRFLERMTAARTLGAVLDRVAEMTLEGAQTTPAAGRFPFLDSILAHEPNRLLAESEITVARHRFLHDHVFFGRNLSVADPELRGLPVMPLAVMLEIMAEAVQALNPAGVIRTIHAVRTMRWLSFEVPTRRLRVEAVRETDGCRATLSEVDHEEGLTPVAEAVFEVAAGESSLSPPAIADPLVVSSWSGQEVYDSMLYHGPAFRGVLWLDSCANHAARAAVREPDPELIAPGGRLVLPVALIDITGQIAGFPLQEELSQEVWPIIFPNTLRRVEFVQQRDPGQVLRAVTRAEVTPTQMRSDCEMVDDAGRVVLRVLDRVEERWRLPGNLFPYWSKPRRTRLSRPLTALFAEVPGIERCVVCEAGNVADKILVNRLWASVLAHMVLSASERRVFAELKLVPVPLASWLLGRVAVKDAVRLLLDLDVCLADVEVEPDAHGRPLVRTLGRPGPLVSLAHTGFAAVGLAGAVDAFAGVGIDLEPIAPLPSTLKEDAFTPQERALIEAVGGPTDSASWYLAAWGAKEATGKALGRGLLGGPGGLEVTAIDPESGRLRVALRGALALAFPQLAGGPGLDAYRRLHANRVITVCLIPRT